MNSRLGLLHPYPFQKLAQLKAGVNPPAEVAAVDLSIGEPKHAAPGFVGAVVAGHLAGLSRYPTTKGGRALRAAIADWANRRFRLARQPLDPERHVLPVCGTREALFSIAQAVVDTGGASAPAVLMPNPFYQIYEGAALLAGAEPYYVNATATRGFLPDLDDVPAPIWARTRLLYLCSPANPTGAVASRAYLTRVLELAERHDFVIAADECYSEIYFDEAQPPLGLLQVADELGIPGYRRCLVFHSLSKRSSLPGLRSGFVAGDPDILAGYLHYRTYHGCAMPSLTQAVSEQAWRDEAHVAANRALYRAKFDAVLDILAPALPVTRPDAGFYLWPETPIDDERFARELYARTHVTVLPGTYLSREAHGENPGHNRVRMALVAPLDECVAAAERIREYLESL